MWGFGYLKKQNKTKTKKHIDWDGYIVLLTISWFPSMLYLRLRNVRFLFILYINDLFYMYDNLKNKELIQSMQTCISTNFKKKEMYFLLTSSSSVKDFYSFYSVSRCRLQFCLNSCMIKSYFWYWYFHFMIFPFYDIFILWCDVVVLIILITYSLSGLNCLIVGPPEQLVSCDPQLFFLRFFSLSLQEHLNTETTPNKTQTPNGTLLAGDISMTFRRKNSPLRLGKKVYEFYTAPITKFWAQTVGVTVIFLKGGSFFCKCTSYYMY